MTIATDLGIPRSTARGWLGKANGVISPELTSASMCTSTTSATC